MTNLITTLEHAYAKAAQDLVIAEKYVTGKILPILKKAATEESTVESITALVDPAAVNIERVAFAVLGLAIKTIDDAGTALGAGALNVPFEAALVADIKAIMASVKGTASTAAVLAVKAI
jgi:hypothetical protein